MPKLIISFFLIGLSFGSGPCLVSCGPLLISYIAGTNKNIFKSLKAYLLFSLSRITVYVIFGLLVFIIGHFIGEYSLGSFSKYIFIAGGFIIILLGILIGLGRNFENKICRRLQTVLLARDNKTVIFLGVVSGIAPCAPLISVIAYIGLVSKNWLSSLFYSLSFGIGTVFSPLLFIALVSGLLPKLTMNKYRFNLIFNAICGLVIIYLGINLLIRGINA